MAEWEGFYTTGQVARLAGVPRATLYGWRERGVISPSVEIYEAGEIVDRGYSYADLTIIRILVALSERRIDLKSAVWALRHIYERLGPPDKGWAAQSVLVAGNRIFVDRPDEWGVTDASQLGQKLEPGLLGDFIDELRDVEEGYSIVVPRQFRHHVRIDPNVMMGEPCVRGYRLPTAVVAIMLRKYGSMDKLAKLYPKIPRDALDQAIQYEKFLNERAA